MTPESLSTHTRRELAGMAKQRRLPGWHSMKKGELIEALLSVNPTNGVRKNSKSDSSAKVPNGTDNKSNGTSSMRWSSRSLATEPIVHQAADDASLKAEAVEPTWIRAEWSVTQSTVSRAESALGAEWHRAVPVIRVVDITSSESGLPSSVIVSEVPVQPGADRWYLNVKEPGRSYRLELGYATPAGRFFALVRSAKVDLPVDMTGFSKRHTTVNSPVSKPSAVTKRASNSPDWDDEAPGDFDELNMDPNVPRTRLQLGAEVTVFGRGEPDAVIDIADERVNLQPDGSFEIRLPLEDGRQVLPVFATANGETRTVVLALERNTKELEPREAVEVRF